MKQANHAPQPLWRRRLPGYAAMGAATLAMALGLHGLMSARTTVAGTLLPLADADAATYGIRAVYQLDENTYYVVGAQKGFQSDVEAGVTLDSTGNVQSVSILAQGETDNLGGQCVDPEPPAPADARGNPPHPEGNEDYHRFRHARPRRSHVHFRHDCRYEVRRGAADRQAAGCL